MAEKDFIDISNKSPKEKLCDELKKVHQEFTIRHEPFDFRNALQAIEDYEQQWTREVQRALSNKQTTPQYRMTWDWSEYGKSERFDKISASPVYDQNSKLGMTTPTLTGYNVDYKVKGKGNGVSVFVPLADWNARNKK